ncbi:MAG: DEAD/DEAH box helicase [Desulfobacteraceae bacterium]|nr:DEAD/DEAH box helicase [Desulfobacteraceae bacterium]
MKEKKGRAKTKKAGKAKKAEPGVSEADFERIEFHRQGLALFPDQSDRRPGIAILVEGGTTGLRHRYCSCSISATRTCAHIRKLVKVGKAVIERLGGKTFEEDFRSSIWYRLAEIMADGCRERPETVRMQSLGSDDKRVIKVCGPSGEEMLYYMTDGPGRLRFLERCGKVPDGDSIPTRGTVLQRLALMTLTENERMMHHKGFKTRRQVMEESFWYRVAYHGYREFGPDACTFHPAIEETSGSFTVSVKNRGGETLFRMTIQRIKVKRLLTAFDDLLPNQHKLAIHPIPLKSIFKVSPHTQLDIEVRPLIQLIQEDGESRFFEREDLERFRYGDLIYIKEMGILAELEPEGRGERKFRAPVKMVLKKSQVPIFFEEFVDDYPELSRLVDEDLKPLKIIREFDRIEISPEVLDRDWCWLSVKYGFGNRFISLAEILSAKKEGQRYIGTDGGWVDCESPELDSLDTVLDRYKEEQSSAGSKGIGLARMDLFRIKAGVRSPIDVTGNGKEVDLFKRMLELKPVASLPKLNGMTSTLRPYQELGVEWIRFLFENGFGGLLCDDMGLGKTHEVMSFMVGMREHEKIDSPFLVVCPTTVLSHWNNKMGEHAPGLKPVVYHGGQRDFEDAVGKSNLLLTSYGILRRDIDKLKNIPFALAVFDEIQYIKNPQTLAYLAAKEIKADMKLGVTGTPIENRLMELKALFDLTIPGYLGTDHDYETGFVKPVELDPDSDKKEVLTRLISPFTLRRRKETVLEDLPLKIEDIRTCELSEDQVKLYRDAIASRGRGLLQSLRNDKESIPYIHIFALLTLLKQICNHPAMMKERMDDYEEYQSGKWELFKELLRESLDSGQKVVVYSQFLGMIRIMEMFLQKEGVDFVTLTGKSRNRGGIISRFNDDPDCRVYLGSLRAGGVGIDLVAASIVIHYDRWWNAAKEDQATDRVHRIGQRRGVHVFKLVTEGTLEEKISAIIQKKRNLMDSIVKETDPGVLKSFSREELIELLSAPVETNQNFH